jgi:hypothetical protein
MLIIENVLHKLTWYGIDTKLIESLLIGRSQYVSLQCGCDVNCSSTKETELGVPQGSCISCVLFSLLINDLCCTIRNSLPVLYADDKTLIAPSAPEELELTINKLEEDIERVVGWLNNSRQLVNDEKTELMLVGRKQQLAPLNPTVRINGQPIKRVESMKILGVIIDCHLNWNKHLAKVTRNCNYSLSQLYPLRSVLSFASRKTLVTALTISHLNYCSSIWMNCSSQNRQSVDCLLRRAARYVCCKDKFDPVSRDFNDVLQWLNCTNRMKFETLKLAFAMFHDIGPKYFSSYLCLDAASLSTRHKRYSRPSLHVKSWWGERSFKFTASRLWLELPINISECTSYHRFKYLVFTHLLSDQSSELNSRVCDNICDLSCIDSVVYGNHC